MNKRHTKMLAITFLVLFITSLASAANISKNEFNRLLELENKLLEQIYEMESELETSRQLETYKKEYLAAIPKTAPRPISDSNMGKLLAAARCVVMGDEHTTNKSQANTITVLNMMRTGKKPVTLVIEWVDQSFQKDIDSFLAGRIPLKNLRSKINFDRLWGFSWSAYSKILTAAKKLKTPVLLVERLKASHSLANRDSFIAGKIAKSAKAKPDMRYLVVYGDYHTLGSNHLSDKLAKEGVTPQLILIGEARDTYWKLLGKLKDPAKIGFATLGKNIYYICNGTPLERSLAYRNYLMKILGYRKSDFDYWVDTRDIVPLSASSSNFERLHKP